MLLVRDDVSRPDPGITAGYRRCSLLTARAIAFPAEPTVREHVLVWSVNGQRVPPGYAACRRCERLIDRIAWAKGCPGKENA